MIADVKAAAWRMMAGMYCSSGLPRLRHRGRVVIVTYHRIASDDMVRTDHIQPGMYVRAQSFEAHAAYLRNRFHVLSMGALLELWRADRLDRGRAYCVITFDDGWQDNYRYAFPVLKKYDLPATIFLATDYIGTSRWFWPDEIGFLLQQAKATSACPDIRKALSNALAGASRTGEWSAGNRSALVESKAPIDSDALIDWCKGLEPEAIRLFVDRLSHELNVRLPDRRVILDWDEVKEMAGHGVTFGSHSCSHRILTNIPLPDVKPELNKSRQALLDHDIKPVPVFCYPNGNFNPEIQALVKASGYLGAVGCQAGLESSRPQDEFALRRIGLHEDSSASLPLLAFALSGLR